MNIYYSYTADIFLNDKLIDCVCNVTEIADADKLSQNQVISLIKEHIAYRSEFMKLDGTLNIVFKTFREHDKIYHH